MSKILAMFFQCSGFFPPIFIQQKQKTVEFFSSVLWILYNDFTNFNFSGQEIWFCYFSSSYFFHNLPSPLIICFILTLPLLILWRGGGGRGASNCVFWKQSPRFQFITTSPKLRNWLKMPNPPNHYDPPDNCNPTHHPQCWTRNTMHGKEILKL